MKQIKTIEVWECQDCGALYAEKLSCWCCVDMDGEYTGKRKGGYEIIKVGEFTKEQLESITMTRNSRPNMDELEELREKMHLTKTWIDAYPLSVFPEPDFEKAHEVLKQHRMTLDSIAASNMRHVLDGIKDIIENGVVKHDKNNDEDYAGG